MRKPVVLDLCCGSGGWAAGFLAEGYRVIGYDIVEQPGYPGHLQVADIRAVNGWRTYEPTCIVASPPCEEFSRHQMPWTRKRNPPPPDLSIWQTCERIAQECGVPIVIENVRAAQNWMGRAAWHSGSYYLWRDVPAIMPEIVHRPKESMSSSWRLQRARVPFELASHIARVYHPGRQGS